MKKHCSFKIAKKTVAVLLVVAVAINTISATETLSLYVRESQTVSCPSLPYGYTTYNCTFASPSTSVSASAVGYYGGTIHVNSYFTGSVNVECHQYYYYYVGNFRYAGHRTSYFIVTCRPINITLNNTSLSLAPDDYYNLTYTASPTTAYSPIVTWESSNPSVAQVSSTGRVHAISAGTAVITAHNGSGPDKTCVVYVQSSSPTSISVSPTSISLPRGQSYTLSHSVTPSNASYSLQWTSSNTAVATVSNGTVYAVSPGSATITAHITGTSLSAACYVTVQPVSPTAIDVPALQSMYVGQNITITPTVTPSNATYSITWTSSNTAVATVNNGVVYGISNGSTRITAQITGTSLYDTCWVNVFRPTLTLQASTYAQWVAPGTSITLTASNNAASIRYTTDGSTPTQTSTLYNGPIPVNDSLTLKAIAYHANYNPSNVLACNYKVNHFQTTGQSPSNYSTTTLPTIPSVSFNKPFAEGSNYSNIKLYVGSSSTNVDTNGVVVTGEKTIIGNTLYFIPSNAGSPATRAYMLHIPAGSLQSDDLEPNVEQSVWYTVNSHASGQSVHGISISSTDDSLVMTVGERHVMRPSLYPTNGAYDTLYWHVANPSIVSVSQYGVVEALATGNTNVTVTAMVGGNTYTATSHVVVSGNYVVSTSVYGGVGGIVSGGGTFGYMNQTTITAIANPCYHFVRWSDWNTNNPRVFTLTQDTSFTAVFAHNDPAIGYESATSCGSYTWKGNTYTVSGTYSFDTLTTLGCDSIVQLYLTIRHTGNTIYTTMRVCDSVSLFGHTFVDDTIITHVWTSDNGAGCDSTERIFLYVTHTTHTSTTAEVCDRYYWHYHTYTQTPDTLPIYRQTDWNGCTNTDTLHLTIHHASSSTDTIEACDSIIWHGTMYTYSTAWPSYNVQGGNVFGCDSTVYLNLTIHRSTSQSIYVNENSASYQWNGSTYTQSGTYTWSGTTEYGCDSVVTLHLTLSGVGIANIEDESSDVVIYPTPTQGVAHIKSTNQIKGVDVFNVQGVQVMHLQEVGMIDLTGLPSGIYLAKVTTIEKTYIIRIVKK